MYLHHIVWFNFIPIQSNLLGDAGLSTGLSALRVGDGAFLPNGSGGGAVDAIIVLTEGEATRLAGNGGGGPPRGDNENAGFKRGDGNAPPLPLPLPLPLTVGLGDNGAGGSGGDALYIVAVDGDGDGGIELVGDGDAVVAIELDGASNMLDVTAVRVWDLAMVVLACIGGGRLTTTVVGVTIVSALNVRARVGAAL